MSTTSIVTVSLEGLAENIDELAGVSVATKPTVRRKGWFSGAKSRKARRDRNPNGHDRRRKNHPSRRPDDPGKYSYVRLPHCPDWSKRAWWDGEI